MSQSPNPNPPAGNGGGQGSGGGQAALPASSAAGATQESTLQKIQELVATLTPVAATVGGPAAGVVAGVAGEAIQLGEVVYNLFDHHNTKVSSHPTMAAAQTAAVQYLKTQHPGALKDAGNQTAMSIVPSIQITAAHVQAQAQPAGSGSTAS